MFGFGRLFNKPEIQDLRNHQGFGEIDVKQLRRNLEILFIDDDEELPVIEILRRLKFNIDHKTDISTLNDVAAYDIILCDIRGVGKEFGSPQEGAYLIKEIKKLFPNKIVIAYTGSTYDPNYNELLTYADNVVTKGTSIDVWTNLLDSEIQKSIDPIEQWTKVRNALLEKNISISIVQDLEAAYVKAIQSKSFDSFEKLAENYNDNDSGAIKLIVVSIMKSILVKLIVGGLVGHVGR